VDKLFSGQCIDAVFHSASYGMSGREQVSKWWIHNQITEKGKHACEKGLVGYILGSKLH